MRRVAVILALLCGGCRLAVVPMPNGKTAFVGSLLTDPAWTSAKINPDGSIELTGYASHVNAEATRNVTAGAVEGLIRSFKP